MSSVPGACSVAVGDAACQEELLALCTPDERLCSKHRGIPVLSTGYFYWLLVEKWHCKSKIASDVKANIGNVPAEAPPGGDRFHLL